MGYSLYILQGALFKPQTAGFTIEHKLQTNFAKDISFLEMKYVLVT